MIKRIMSVSHVNKEYVPEYILRHDNIPEALLAEYRKYGIIHISCFLDENDTLYCYQEYDDAYDCYKDAEHMPVNAIWQKDLEPCRDKSFTQPTIREVFHM